MSAAFRFVTLVVFSVCLLMSEDNANRFQLEPISVVTIPSEGSLSSVWMPPYLGSRIAVIVTGSARQDPKVTRILCWSDGTSLVLDHDKEVLGSLGPSALAVISQKNGTISLLAYDHKNKVFVENSATVYATGQEAVSYAYPLTGVVAADAVVRLELPSPNTSGVSDLGLGMISRRISPDGRLSVDYYGDKDYRLRDHVLNIERQISIGTTTCKWLTDNRKIIGLIEHGNDNPGAEDVVACSAVLHDTALDRTFSLSFNALPGHQKASEELLPPTTYIASTGYDSFALCIGQRKGMEGPALAFFKTSPGKSK